MQLIITGQKHTASRRDQSMPSCLPISQGTDHEYVPLLPRNWSICSLLHCGVSIQLIYDDSNGSNSEV